MGPWSRRLLPAAVTVAIFVTGAGLVTPTAAAGASADIVLTADADARYVDVSIDRSIGLADIRQFGQPGTDLGTSRGGRYVGFGIYRLPDMTPVVGAVELELFTAQLRAQPNSAADENATVGLMQTTDRLEPGRYRFLLLADGGGTARIPTTDLPEPLRLTAAVPHPTAGVDIATASSTGPLPVAGRDLDVRSESGGTLLLAWQSTARSATSLTSTQFCFDRRDAPPCTPIAGNSPGTNPKGLGTTVTLPYDGNAFKVGRYRARFASSGDQQLTYLMLTIGPGPRPLPVLPTAQPPDSNTDGYSRARDLLDVCPTGTSAGRFSDTAGSAHEAAVDCLAALGVAQGSSAGQYRPAGSVTRGQLASLLDRAVTLGGRTSSGPLPTFRDTSGSVHRDAIARMARLGVVTGFADGSYRPDEPVTRAQAASLVHRAYAVVAGLPLRRVTDYFRDDAGSVHETNIDALTAYGIAQGVNALQFSPDSTLSRGQAASLVARAMDLLAELRRVAPVR